MNFKNNELLMLGGAFILGVFVDRYMNHRDIVTGEVKEGLPDPMSWTIVQVVLVCVCVVIICVCIVVVYKVLRSRRGDAGRGNLSLDPTILLSKQ